MSECFRGSEISKTRTKRVSHKNQKTGVVLGGEPPRATGAGLRPGPKIRRTDPPGPGALMRYGIVTKQAGPVATAGSGGATS